MAASQDAPEERTHLSGRYQQTFALTIKDDASRVVASDAHVVSGDAEESFSVVCPGSGNVSVPVTIDVSTVVAFWIMSTKSDVTLTFNDDGSPDLTVVLVANVPYWWYTGLGANPLSVDLTGASAIKLVKSTATDALVTGAFLTT